MDKRVFREILILWLNVHNKLSQNSRLYNLATHVEMAKYGDRNWKTQFEYAEDNQVNIQALKCIPLIMKPWEVQMWTQRMTHTHEHMSIYTYRGCNIWTQPMTFPFWNEKRERKKENERERERKEGSWKEKIKFSYKKGKTVYFLCKLPLPLSAPACRILIHRIKLSTRANEFGALFSTEQFTFFCYFLQTKTLGEIVSSFVNFSSTGVFVVQHIKHLKRMKKNTWFSPFSFWSSSSSSLLFYILPDLIARFIM